MPSVIHSQNLVSFLINFKQEYCIPSKCCITASFPGFTLADLAHIEDLLFLWKCWKLHHRILLKSIRPQLSDFDMILERDFGKMESNWSNKREGWNWFEYRMVWNASILDYWTLRRRQNLLQVVIDRMTLPKYKKWSDKTW